MAGALELKSEDPGLLSQIQGIIVGSAGQVILVLIWNNGVKWDDVIVVITVLCISSQVVLLFLQNLMSPLSVCVYMCHSTCIEVRDLGELVIPFHLVGADFCFCPAEYSRLAGLGYQRVFHVSSSHFVVIHYHIQLFMASGSELRSSGMHSKRVLTAQPSLWLIVSLFTEAPNPSLV